jgi:hypothetical protein
VRIGTQHDAGIGDPHLLKPRDRPIPGGAPAHPLVAAQHFGDLFSDGVDRVEAGHRFLENHADPFAPHLSIRASVRASRSCPSNWIPARGIEAGRLRESDA